MLANFFVHFSHSPVKRDRFEPNERCPNREDSRARSAVPVREAKGFLRRNRLLEYWRLLLEFCCIFGNITGRPGFVLWGFGTSQFCVIFCEQASRMHTCEQ